MAPFYSYEDPLASGFSNSLTPLIVRITMITVAVGSFFQSNNMNISTVAILILIAVFFETATKATKLLGKLVADCCLSQRVFREGAMEYQWIKRFMVHNQMFQDSALVLDGADDSAQEPRSRSFWWRGNWIQVTYRNTCSDSYVPYGLSDRAGKLEIEIKAYSVKVSPISNLLQEAREIFQGTGCHERIAIHSWGLANDSGAYPYNSTGQWSGRTRRNFPAMDSTSLSVGTLMSLVDESRKFWESGTRYSEVGLPFRKGYLLHGPSGSGKCNAVFALAGKLGREVYSLSFKRDVVNDATLLKAISTIPKASIFLLEDIDSIFDIPTTEPFSQNGCCPPYPNFNGQANGIQSTLLGIMKMMDSLKREDGILLFATTSKLTGFSEALFQPGRFDKTIDFGYISKERSKMIFKRFFPSKAVNEQAARQNYFDDVKYPATFDLAEGFSRQIPENELTIRDIQFYLISQQSESDAICGVADWIVTNRERRERIEAEEQAAIEASKAKLRQNAPISPWIPAPIPPYPPTPPENLELPLQSPQLPIIAGGSATNSAIEEDA